MEQARGTFAEGAFGLSASQHGSQFKPANRAHGYLGCGGGVALELGAIGLADVEFCKRGCIVIGW